MKLQIYALLFTLCTTASPLARGADSSAVSTAPTTGYASMLESIAMRSSQLTAAQKGHEAALRGFRTGLAPDDPEVALEYFFDKETRYELVLEQRFDFPTVYHQRNKIAKLQSSRSAQELLSARRSLISQISDNYLRGVYALQRGELLRQRQAHLHELVALYTKGVDEGMISAVELESARMLLVSIDMALATTESELSAARGALRQVNGGEDVPLGDYPLFGFTGTQDEFVAAAMRSDYDLRAAELDTLIAGRMLKLSRNEWIPRIKVGYKLEMEGTKPANALIAGFSLPLWQNSGKVRHAKALNEAARAVAHTTTEQAQTRLASLFVTHQTLSRGFSSLPTTTGSGSNPRSGSASGDEFIRMTESALKAGSISSITYIQGLSQWYDTQDSRAQLEYDVAQAGAAMMLCLM